MSHNFLTYLIGCNFGQLMAVSHEIPFDKISKRKNLNLFFNFDCKFLEWSDIRSEFDGQAAVRKPRASRRDIDHDT